MALDGVGMRFGSLDALKDLTFDIRRGEILGIAGPNGAGKSTLLNVCTGGLTPTSGAIRFKGRQIGKLRRFQCCHLGIGRTFQIPKVFSSMTVEQNIATGQVFGAGSQRAQDDVLGLEDLLDLTGLASRRDLPAGQADLIVRKSIMLAGALATAPEVIFMDEPLGGLNAEEIEEFSQLVSKVHKELGTTFVLVEHKTRALAALSDRILILNFGEMICLDAPEVVLNDEHVVEIYLGVKHDA